MNKKELQKRYQEIVLKTNGGNEDYVVALCQIASAINELDESKQDDKLQKLKEWVAENKYKQLDDRYIERLVDVVDVDCLLLKMQELEAEDAKN